MGINISVHRVTKYGDECEFSSLPSDEWDSLRHVGDLEFAQQPFDELNCYKNDLTHDYFLCRPKDFHAIKRWVYENIPKGNQDRLTGMIERMKDDKDLWFYFIY